MTIPARYLLLMAHLVAFVPCCDGAEEAGSGTEMTGEWSVPCNGSYHLCDLPYDEVSYVTSHNSMATEEDGFGGPNHVFGLTQQLEDGVRAWMLDIHPFQDGVSLCHGYCFFGERPLIDGLVELQAFLSTHPGAVFTLFFESYVSAGAVAEAFEESGLDKWVYVHEAGQSWPTLGEMVSTGKRLVVFTDAPDEGPDWYMDVWDHCWETHWSNHNVDDFDCQVNRGSSDHSLFILNHFLTSPIALIGLAEEVNAESVLQQRVVQCTDEAGQIPNFVVVDFYSVGDVFSVVDGLNRVSP